MYILYIYLYIFIYLYLFVFIYLYLLRHLEENVIPMRRKLAKEVSVKGWDKSPHVGHLRWNRTFKNLSPIWYSDHQNKEFSKLPKKQSPANSNISNNDYTQGSLQRIQRRNKAVPLYNTIHFKVKKMMKMVQLSCVPECRV